MVGKTNLTFISKGEGAGVQVIQKSYVTGTTESIYKMEEINGKLYVFAYKRYVLTGPGIDGLDFIKKGNEKLKATHIVYADGVYYIMDASSENLDDPKIYATSDFQNYEEIDLKNSGIMENHDDSGVRLAGLFLDSKGNIIVAYYNVGQRILYIGIVESLKQNSEVEMVKIYLGSASIDERETFLIGDKIYIGNGWCNLTGSYTEAPDIRRYRYTSGYFFFVSNRALYRSRDGISKIRYNHEIPVYSSPNSLCIIPINGKHCYLYMDVEGNPYLNIADDVLKIGCVENETIQLCDPIEAVDSVVEYDGKTYLGTRYGVIYELQLDYEGTIQRPDVTVIKTLAAKQALAQSLQYTDDKIKELKNYIDGKLVENASAEDNSTGVEG